MSKHTVSAAGAALPAEGLTSPAAHIAALVARIAALSFVAADGHRWNVKSTGDWSDDYKVGMALALEYLAYEESDGGPAVLLQQIVAAMPRDQTGVEMGFLSLVSRAAGAGADRSRQIVAYWDRCNAKREAAKAKRVERENRKARRAALGSPVASEGANV